MAMTGRLVLVETITSCCASLTGVRNPTCDPIAISAAKGTRNLTDAASHSACRTAAAFLRNASVISPIAAANRVDCQR